VTQRYDKTVFGGSALPSVMDVSEARQLAASLEERMSDLTEQERLMFTLVCQFIGTAGASSAVSAEAELERRVDAVETAITDIRGESGHNGKLGALKERVDKAELRRWWAVTFIAGLIVTILASAIAFGRWMSSLETDVQWLKARTQRVRGMTSEQLGEDTRP
jgi:hypothetical protein